MIGLTPEQFLTAWEDFVYQQSELTSIHPRIMKSWKRCRAYLNPFQHPHPNHLSEETLLAAQVAGFDLISVARPLLEEIFEHIEHNGTAVLLTNNAGYVLDILTDAAGGDLLQSLGIKQGVSLTENQYGTNAFGLTLVERMPARVIGAEHYLRSVHTIADIAAPVFDWNGSPLGSIGMITRAANYHPNNYALIMLGARTIRSQRQSDLLLNQRAAQINGMRTILNGLSEPTLIWNSQDQIIFANPAAETFFNHPARSLLNLPYQEIAAWPKLMLQALERKDTLARIRLAIKTHQSTVACLVSLQFIQIQHDSDWTVLTLRLDQEEKRSPAAQAEASSTRLTGLMIETPEMRRVWRLAKQAAAARASVLVQGEPGTGKSDLVRIIFEEGPQHEGPFILYPCASALPEMALEELLGYAEGVVSKQPEGRPGKFELADGGALFFQDIDQLPLQAQNALLNYLNLGLIQRLGGDQAIRVEARILASTSANLEKLVAEKRFRAQLYYRLSAFKISLPSLSQRKRDLPILVERILERLSKEHNRSYRLGPEVMEAFEAYSWPGNLHELESVIAGAIPHVSISGVINTAHLPERVREPASFTGQIVPLDLRSMKEIEEETLIQAARLYHGNVTRMAEALQIGRTTVWRKLKEFNILLDPYREKVSMEIEQRDA